MKQRKTAIDFPYQWGFDAWTRMLSLEDNPYTRGDQVQQNADWAAGWRAAEDAGGVRIKREEKTE